MQGRPIQPPTKQISCERSEGAAETWAKFSSAGTMIEFAASRPRKTKPTSTANNANE